MSSTLTAKAQQQHLKASSSSSGLEIKYGPEVIAPAPLPNYLSVKQLAELLHINEKKVYQLANEGEIPCTKVTGKWIFPTQLIENWIFENSHGGVMTDRLVIAGSEDVLVHRTCNRLALELQNSAMVSYSPCGTRHGLRMLETGKIDACFINWGSHDSQGLRHRGLLRGYRNHNNWVIVRLLQRHQGLIVSPRLVVPDHSIDALLKDRRLRWALRQDTAGSTRVLQDECNARRLDLDQLEQAVSATSERSAVAAVSTGLADITCGAECVAREYNLHFVPVTHVALDLVMLRKTYFRTLIQEYLNAFKQEQTHIDADMLGGYKIYDEFELMTVDT